MIDPASRLLLIDGHAAAYRFHFGIRSMTTSTGQPLQAVFGFIRLLQQLRSWWKPTHWAVAFDGGLPASRLALVPAYKAQRKPMPDELRQQLPVMREYLDAAAIPAFCLEGEEADDLIATFATHASGHVMIATGDKDLFQLVSETTGIVALSGESITMTPAMVEAKTGVPPRLIPDWLALTGDTADNIKGVPSVGPKTAARLLQQYGSIGGIYAHLDEIPGDRLRHALISHHDIVLRNRKMVLLQSDVPGLPAVMTLSCRPEPFTALRAFYDRYELHHFSRKMREPDLFD